MNTRTMRREVFEAHEETRKAALRKRCIYRCRMDIITNVTKIAAFVCAIAFVVGAATNVVAYNSGKDLIDEAKTPAIERMAVTVEEEVTPIVAIKDTSEVEEDEALEEVTLSSIQYSQPISNSLKDAAEKVVSSINEQKEEVVEETTTTSNTGSYDPNQPVSLTNRYKHPTYQYTQEDYEYLLMTIVGEAQNCSYEHQMYVGSVVLNRLHNDKYFKYANCIKDVVLAKSQYTCFSNGGAYRTPTDLNIQVAHDLIDNGSALPGNVIFQAEFTQGDGIYVHLGNTYFCYKY